MVASVDCRRELKNALTRGMMHMCTETTPRISGASLKFIFSLESMVGCATIRVRLKQHRSDLPPPVTDSNNADDAPTCGHPITTNDIHSVLYIGVVFSLGYNLPKGRVRQHLSYGGRYTQCFEGSSLQELSTLPKHLL